jgi:inner membrane protein
MGSTHAMAGFVLWLALEKAHVSPPIGIIVVVVGSVLPDIDHPNGTIRQLVELPEFLKHPVAEIIPHRGPTHTLWAGIAFSILTTILAVLGNTALLVSLATGLAMFAGYLSHLVLDSLNPTGVRWLRPWSDFHPRWIIRTGSKGEEYFFYTLIALLVITAAV